MRFGETERSPVRAYHLTCRDGSVKDVEITFTVVGDITYVVFHDITDRKRADTALRESERRLNTLISNLPGAVYRCKADPDWTVEFISEGYPTLTGYSTTISWASPGLVTSNSSTRTTVRESSMTCSRQSPRNGTIRWSIVSVPQRARRNGSGTGNGGLLRERRTGGYRRLLCRPL